MMTKIKGNIRGDSGLTDSQLTRSQNIVYEKNRKALDELEQYGIMETRRRRYEANARPPKRRKSFWKTIKGWFGYV